MKGPIAVILFIAIAAVVEYLIVLYTIALGLVDSSILQWSFNFPGTSWQTAITISPIFHLVPVCVIIALTLSWIYLTKRAMQKRQEIRRGRIEPPHGQRIEKKGITSRISRATRNFLRRTKLKLSKTKGISYISQKIQSSRPTLRSAVIVLLVFAAFTLLFSLLAYPQLIYRLVSSAYQNNAGFLGFVASLNDWIKGVGQALGPLGGIGAAINNALLASAPAVRGMGAGLGNLITPLAALDGAGKYLVFQNAAIWISVLIVLIYGERIGKGYRYKK